MPTETAASQDATQQSVLTSPPVNNESSTIESTTEVSAGADSPVEHSAESSAADIGQSESGLQDFDSVEELAQALIDKKQSALSTQQSAKADTQTGSEADTQPEKQQGQEKSGAPEQAPEEQAQQEQPQFSLDEDDVFSPRELNERINANPQLKQALESDPALRNAVFRNARLASETSQYKGIFPDVESAQYAAQSAATFREIDDLFLNAATPNGTGRFLQKWAEMAMLTDERGNPVMENGVPKLHPAFTSMLNNMRDNELNFLQQKAEKAGDQELIAALDIVRERISPASRARDEELPPHIKAAADHIKARETELNRRQLEQQYAEQVRSDRVIGDETTGKINALIEPALNHAALSDFVRQTARSKIDDAIVESLARNRFFQARLAELARYPLTPENRQQRVNLVMSHVQAIAGPIVRQVLREASQPVLQAQEDRRNKIDAQVARSRSEPKSSTSASSIGRSAPPDQLFEQIRNDYITRYGDEPSMQQVIELFAVARRNK